MNISDLQALQNQTPPDVEMAQAKFRVSQLEKEVERLNKALEQAVEIAKSRDIEIRAGNVDGFVGTRFSGCLEECPELFAWLKENR